MPSGAAARIAVAALRNEERSTRSSATKVATVALPLTVTISSRTGWALACEPPARMRRFGFAAARARAAVAPMPPVLGPVITFAAYPASVRAALAVNRGTNASLRGHPKGVASTPMFCLWHGHPRH